MLGLLHIWCTSLYICSLELGMAEAPSADAAAPVPEDAAPPSVTAVGSEEGAAKSGTAAAGAENATGKKDKDKKKKKKRKAGWTEAKENPWIYVKGLPEDVTEDELAGHFRKVGILKSDFESKRPKVKVYRDAHGMCKVSAAVCECLCQS